MQNYEIGGDNKIKSFTDLNAYKEAHKLVLLIYEITKEFPKEERFCLIAKDLKYLNQQIFNQIAQQSIVVRKLISGLKRIKYQNEKI